MKKYDYIEAMKADIRAWMEDNEQFINYEDKDDLVEQLDEMLWTADSVTGNASGSYTFNRAEAKENVLANIDLLKEAYEEFCQTDRFAEQFFNEDWETMDVTIRCYLLNQAIWAVIDEDYEEQ